VACGAPAPDGEVRTLDDVAADVVRRNAAIRARAAEQKALRNGSPT
jgi:hypothetical protein